MISQSWLVFTCVYIYMKIITLIMDQSWIFHYYYILPYSISISMYSCIILHVVNSFFSHYHLSHDGSMYGVHMLTWLGYIDGIHVGSPPGGSSPCSHGSHRISSPVLLRAAPRPCDQSAPAVRIQRRCSRSPWRWEICANYVLNGLINIVMNIVINSD